MTAAADLPRMVLLDRDGVLNLDRPDSVKTLEELVVIPGAAEAVARLNAAGILAVVASNQSVVGRGVISQAELDAINDKLRSQLADKGARLDALIVCTDAPEQATERRKPGPGMLREALERFGVEAGQALVVGDALRDLEAGAALGCPLALVRTGKGAALEKAGIPPALGAVAVYDDLSDAVNGILGKPVRVRRRSGFGAFLLTGLFFAALAWALGFAVFVSRLPDHVADPARQTDAIVVLTGGGERVSTGLGLLAQGLGKRLLISGVHQDVDEAKLLKMTPEASPSLSCCIDLGYEANDTIGNALESAAWMRAQGFHSLRLVTASYHLPRSLLEFHRAMPEAEIVPHPVFPASVQGSGWWRRPASLWVVGEEYTKYLAARLRHALFTPAPGGP
jgi:histidinol-phosphate phosphatase family protein